MSLSATDLHEIRSIVKDVVDSAISPLQDEIEALRSDIKEIYDRLTRLESKIMPDKEFGDLSLEHKILKLNSELLLAAKQAGIILPR